MGRQTGLTMNLNFTLVLEILSFLILLGLLVKFLYRPVTKYLDERAMEISEATKNAKKYEEKARFHAGASEKTLNEAKEESIKIRKEARRLADGERRRIIEEAKKEARFLMEKSVDEFGREKEELIKNLRKDVATISADIAGRILGREISEKDHERLIKDSIEELEDEAFGT